MTWRVAGALLRLLLLSVAARADYRPAFTIRSMTLLQAKCSECYVGFGNSNPRYGECCDEFPSCQSTSCDIRLNLCIFTSTPNSQPSSHGCATMSRTGLEAGEVLRPGRLTLYAPVTSQNANTTTFRIMGHLEDPDPGTSRDDTIDRFDVSWHFGELLQTTTLTVDGTYGFARLELGIEVVCQNENSCTHTQVDQGENVCESSMNPCQNGDCIDEDGGFRCVCYPGYMGPLCDIDVTSVNCISSQGSCSGRGECVSGACSCVPGYTGEFCESELPVVDTTTTASQATTTEDISINIYPDTTTPQAIPTDVTTGTSFEATTSQNGSTNENAATSQPQAGSAAAVMVIIGAVVGGVLILLVLALIVVLVIIVMARMRREKRIKMEGLNMHTLSSSNRETNIYEEAGRREDVTSSLTATNGTIRNLDNPLYNTSSTRTQHDYESIDTLESNIHQNLELERNFVNPIYGDDTNTQENQESERNFVNPIYGDDSIGGNAETTSSQRQKERSTQYDQLGHIYYTLENEEDREERYATTTQLQAEGEGDGGKGEQNEKRADHSYEDVQ